MKIFTDFEIQNALDGTPQHVEDKIWAYETAVLIDKVADNYHIPKEQKQFMGEEVLYVLLRLTTQEEMGARVSELLGLPQETATQLTADILAKLMSDPATPVPPQAQRSGIPLGETVPQASSNVPEKLELRPEGVVRHAPVPQGPAAKPLTREDVLSALSPKRTMASDIASVQQTERSQEEQSAE